MVNTYELKIKQSGNVSCPICHKSIDWSYKMETMWMPEWDRFASSYEEKPTRLINHFFNEDGKVIFRICCERCNSCIETKPMDLIEKGNGEQSI